MNSKLDFLVNSNVYLAFGAAAIAYICMVLVNAPFRWEPLVISFCTTLFLYNLNRHTDMEEDRINSPKRVSFVERRGKSVFFVSGVLYALALVLAATNGLATVLLTLTPFILVLLYSVIRLKKFLVFKNIIVAAGWALITFLVLSYSGVPLAGHINVLSMSVFAFVFVRVLIDTIVFDILDMSGDKKSGVKTIANTYGVGKVKRVCTVLNVASTLFFLAAWNFIIPSVTFAANLIIVWSFIYIYLINRVDVNGLSDLIVDGEITLLGMVTFIFQMLLAG